MRRLGFYLFSQLMTAFVFATAAVTFVVLFSQLFRLLSLVIDNSSTFMIFIELLGLSIPTFLPLVLPLALGVAVLFIYHKLGVDSELVVMRAAGVSPLRIAAPALALGVLVLFVCLNLTLWLSPVAARQLVALQYKVRDSYAVFLSRPGAFNDITDGLTFYANRRSGNGALEGILIHDVRAPAKPVTIMAETGQVASDPTTKRPEIMIFNGRRQEMDLTTGKLSELAFDQYVLDLDALRSASSPRMPDPREQSVWQVLSELNSGPNARATPERLRAEIYQRLASPLLVLSYVMIGLSTMLAGQFNRRGMGQRILIAAIAVVVTQALFMSMNGFIVRYNWLGFLLFLIACAPVVAGFLLLTREQWVVCPHPAAASAKKPNAKRGSNDAWLDP